MIERFFNNRVFFTISLLGCAHGALFADQQGLRALTVFCLLVNSLLWCWHPEGES